MSRLFCSNGFAVREASIAAALAAFDGQLVDHAASTAPVVHLTHRRRPRWPALLLSGAAAAAVVGVVGTVVLNDRDGSDGSASKTSEQFSTEANRAVTADSMPSVSTIGSITGPASAVPVISTASELLGFAPAISEVAPSGGASSTTAAADSQTSDGVGARGCPLGENQIVVGDIIWIDIPAVAVRDTVSGVVQAIDDQCNVLVAAEP